MKNKMHKQFGSWPSLLSASELATSASRMGHFVLENARAYWLESIPEEAGRIVIYWGGSDEPPQKVTPDGFSVRSRVHEYGGGDFSVKDETIIFCNDEDQRLYLQKGPGSHPQPITAEPEFKHALRYADIEFSKCGNWIVCVRERHSIDGNPLSVINELIKISLVDNSVPEILVEGSDFYSYPRISPDGCKLIWTCWQHPHMPWDQTALWVADLDKDGQISHSICLINNENESICQPSWSPDGKLFFVSDCSGWWNIYSFHDLQLKTITLINAEFALPQWQFGISRYDFADCDTIYAIYVQNGRQKLCLIEVDKGLITPIELPYCSYQSALYFADDHLYFMAGSEICSPSLIVWDLTKKKGKMISQSNHGLLQTDDIATAEHITFPTANKKDAHAFYYPATNAEYQGLENEKPPLIVMSHGGPTGAASAEYNANIQFWTSRGFAVVDVNYGGSTGFGREYRQRLQGQWGIVDVEDCVNAAQYLVESGRVDPNKLAIRGGSAGGYTTYAALTNYRLFSAGVSRYGVADLTCLVKESHKFEVRYLDSMIGPWPAEKALYYSRSPINHADKFNCPVLLLQGDEDAVVPPAQSITMAAALDKKQIPHALLMLEGEQHGFRKSENICLAMEAELNFYGQIFNFSPADKLPPLTLKHAHKLLK